MSFGTTEKAFSWVIIHLISEDKGIQSRDLEDDHNGLLGLCGIRQSSRFYAPKAIKGQHQFLLELYLETDRGLVKINQD